MNIPMPTQEEKNRSCDLIIKKTYTKTFSKKLYHSIKTLGFFNLWIGIEVCVLVPTLCTLIYLITSLPDYIQKFEQPPLEIFLVAPLFYGNLLFLSLWKEKEDEVHSLKQACFFSLTQLTSLRCLCFGSIAAIFQLVTMIVVFIFGGELSLSSILLSLSLLFFYGGVSLFTLRKTHTLLAHGLTFSLWCFMALSISNIQEDKRNIVELLSSINIGVYIFAFIPTVLFLFTQLKKYFLQGELSCYQS